jgi:hypothetical protein
MFAIVFAALALTGALLHLLFAKHERFPKRMAEILLLYWFAVAIGAAGVFEFVGHTFRADQVAASIGWPAGNPFQQDVAFADLALGVLGLGCISVRGGFWTATAIAATLMGWGDALGHLNQFVRYSNHHPGNSGVVLWSDIFVPVVAIGLLILHSRLAQSGTRSAAGNTAAN